MIRKIRSLKLHTKLLLLIILSSTCCVLLFCFLWLHTDTAWKFAKNFPPFYFDDENLVEQLRIDAKNYELPDYDDGKNQKDDFGTFFSHADDYTGVYIYGADDGLYIASQYPYRFDDVFAESLMQLGGFIYNLYSSESLYHALESESCYNMEFKNGSARVYINSYRSAFFIIPYTLVLLVLCIILFLWSILFYVNRRIKTVLNLNQEILLMSSGDLTHPIPACGFDEIGILGRELDALRTTLASNIERETFSRQSNQDLITAMSHDLRTPLTILKGYLEVLKLKRNDPAQAETYLDRCLKKTDDIKEMTNKMFEYALVFEEKEDLDAKEIPLAFLTKCLKENLDFLQLAGFTVPQLCLPLTGGVLDGDAFILKRIFQNLFSNILKYGDKSVPVSLDVCCLNSPVKNSNEQTSQLKITLSNQVKSDTSGIASSGIGLKSVGRMMQLHHGCLKQWETEGTYYVELTFPLR